MDPQRDPLAPQPGDDQQNSNHAGPAPGVPPSKLSEEAASTPAAAAPVAGQTIAPNSPAPAANTPDAGAAPEPAAGDSGADTPEPAAPQPGMPSEPAAPADVPADPLPINSGKRRKKGLLIGLIIAAVILLLSGGAAAAYFGYYLPNKPENVLKKALANSFDLQKSKTIHFSGEATIGSEEEDFSVKTTYNGQMDHTSGSFLFSGVTDALVTKVTSEVRSADGKNLYFKVGGLDGLSELLALSGLEGAGAFAPGLATLNDQWIEVSEGFLSQSIGDSYKGFKLSESDARKLAAAYDQNQFLVIKEVLPDAEVKGVASHHYRVGYDMPKFKSFLRAVNAANLDAIKLTDEQLDELDRGLDEIDTVEPWDIWIGKKDKMVRQMAIEMTDEGATFDFTFTIDSYNQPVTVEKPENAMSVLELLSIVLGGVDQATIEEELETLFTQEFTEEPLELEVSPSAGISL